MYCSSQLPNGSASSYQMESFTDNPTVGSRKPIAQMIHFGGEDPWRLQQVSSLDARREREGG